MIAHFIIALPCLHMLALGVAPQVAVVPPVLPPVLPLGAAPAPRAPGAFPSTNAAPPEHSAGVATRPTPRLRGQPPVIPTKSGWTDVETKLSEILSDTSESDAANYYEAEALGLPKLSNGDPSVSALIDLLEAANPPSPNFDLHPLVGEWQLAFSNSDLPAAMREEVARRGEENVADLSVVLSIGDSGTMNTRSALSFIGGETKLFNAPSRLAQQGFSPSFSISAPGTEPMSMEVTYLSNAFLVLRKHFQADPVLGPSELTQVSPSRTEIWRKITEKKTITGPAPLWHFGFPVRERRTPLYASSTGEVPRYWASSFVLGASLLAAMVMGMMRSHWSQKYATSNVSSTTEMTSKDVQPAFAVAAFTSKQPDQAAPLPADQDALSRAGVEAGDVLSKDSVHAGVPFVMPLKLDLSLDWKKAEVHLMDLFRTSLTLEVNDPVFVAPDSLVACSSNNKSVAGLLGFLESVNPPPAHFDRKMLVGEWYLEYTNDLPVAVRSEVETQIQHDAIQSLSVRLSIGISGTMRTTATISLGCGEKKVLTLYSHMAQVQDAPRFSVYDQDGDSAFLDVTYMSDELLVLRKNFDRTLYALLGQALDQPKTAVWRKVVPTMPSENELAQIPHEEEDPVETRPLNESLARFGLLSSSAVLNQDKVALVGAGY